MNCTIRRLLSTVLTAVSMAAMLNVAILADNTKHTVSVHIRGNGPAAARVRVLADDGQEYSPEAASVRRTKAGNAYFYADGFFKVAVPQGRVRMFVSGGIEHVPQTIVLDVDSDLELTVPLRPWIDMASRGWFSGDSHVHLNTGGRIGATIADALVAARAEGVNYVNLCVSNNTGDDIRDAEMITGKPHALSTERHLLVFGEEMRSSIYGHMQFFGISKLVEPQYTGFANTPNHFDFPANHVMAAEACRQGGIVTYGHPMFAGQPLPFTDDLTADNAAARELPIDAILNVAQAMDLMSYNSDEHLSAELWYRLLNCGLQLSACVGTDALLDQSTEPLGGSRVYVKTNGPLTMSNWLQGLAAGRTFVTNGPMLQLDVQGVQPGATRSTAAGNVRIRARVESHVPFDRVEVIVNGDVRFEKAVAEDSGAAMVRIQQFETDLTLERSSWVALRVRGPDHAAVFDGPVWAHTSAVYVLVDDQPIRSTADAQYFMEWIDQLLRVVAARNRYATVEDRQQVESVFRRARDEFRRRADKDREPNPGQQETQE